LKFENVARIHISTMAFTTGKASFGRRYISLCTATTRCCSKRFFADIASNYKITGTIPEHGLGVAVGQYAQVERVFSEPDVATYGVLVGDNNPLHQQWKRGTEPDVVATSPLVQWSDEEEEESNDRETVSKILVHGMLVASLFTCVFGELIPGSIYLKQTLDFRKPVYVDDKVRGRVTITAIRQWKRRGLVLTCDTHVFRQDDLVCIQGQADVWLVQGKTLENRTGHVES
jgi:acyl dehydratase